jgi:hypothetical protein
MPNKSVHLTRGAGAPRAGKLRRYAGTVKARSDLGPLALRSRFPKTLRGKAAVKYWEIIADRLRKAGWSLGWVSAIDSEGRTIWIADAHRDDGNRFNVRADEKLSAFVELERQVLTVTFYLESIRGGNQ